MKTIRGFLLLALDSYAQDDFTEGAIAGLGLDDDFIDFIEDGGGLDGADYALDGADYSDYYYDDSNEDGRSRPGAEVLDSLREAAAASIPMINTYEYIDPPEIYDYRDYDSSAYADLKDEPITAPDDSSVDGLTDNADGARRPVGSTLVQQGLKQLVGAHFDEFGVSSTGYSCYTVHAIGRDTASTVTAFSSGSVEDCRGQGNGDYCKIEVRTLAGQVRQISTGCAQADYCSGIRNFGDTDNTSPFVPEPSRSDECRPLSHKTGATFMINKRFKFGESVCRTCFYPNDGTTDGSSNHGLFIDAGNIFIKNGAAKLHSTSITAWKREMWYNLAFDLQTP